MPGSSRAGRRHHRIDHHTLPAETPCCDTAGAGLTAAGQASDADWDRSVEKQDLDEFRVHMVTSRTDALDALRDIGLQGEGPSAVPS